MREGGAGGGTWRCERPYGGWAKVHAHPPPPLENKKKLSIRRAYFFLMEAFFTMWVCLATPPLPYKNICGRPCLEALVVRRRSILEGWKGRCYTTDDTQI